MLLLRNTHQHQKKPFASFATCAGKGLGVNEVQSYHCPTPEQIILVHCK